MDSSLLSKLPAELRDTVYRMVLVSAEPLRVSDVPEHTALLRTCAQLRREATGIFYENIIRMTCGTGDGQIGAAWVKLMGSQARQFTSITIDFDGSSGLYNQFYHAIDDITAYQLSEEWGDDVDKLCQKCNDATKTPLASLMAESCPLAIALSSAVKSVNLPLSQANVHASRRGSSPR